MDNEVKEFLESLSYGLTPTVSYPEWESWVRAMAKELLDKEPAKTLKFCKYLNTGTREIEEWALDQARNVMVNRQGHYWGFGGECGFFDHHELVFDDQPKSLVYKLTYKPYRNRYTDEAREWAFDLANKRMVDEFGHSYSYGSFCKVGWDREFTPAKTMRFREYYNTITGETARWARDGERQVMVDEFGGSWRLNGANNFYDKGWRLVNNMPGYSAQLQQLDIDALKRQVRALDILRQDAEHKVSDLEQRVEILEASSKLETVRLSNLVRKMSSLLD